MAFAVLSVSGYGVGSGDVRQFGLSAPQSLKDRIVAAAAHDGNVSNLQENSDGMFCCAGTRRVPIHKLLGWIKASGYVFQHAFGLGGLNSGCDHEKQYIFKQED